MSGVDDELEELIEEEVAPLSPVGEDEKESDEDSKEYDEESYLGLGEEEEEEGEKENVGQVDSNSTNDKCPSAVERLKIVGNTKASISKNFSSITLLISSLCSLPLSHQRNDCMVTAALFLSTWCLLE
mmetsp:Transcript_16895/g.26321  ORF Transcript_16895/g.26321 Transcript_16895/m.26321 type:complete len:128 (+) Transcript_16895:919-1302(+)